MVVHHIVHYRGAACTDVMWTEGRERGVQLATYLGRAAV
jgi:hypothetical protein